MAVQGLGGLGHLGIQFASQLGYCTVAIGRGQDKEALALKLVLPLIATQKRLTQQTS